MSNTSMTKNEYDKFLSQQANDAWGKAFSIAGGIGKEITLEQKAQISQVWKDFDSAVDTIKILPFDLSEYNLPENIENVINIYFTSEREDAEVKLLEGHCELSSVYKLAKQFNMNIGLDLGYSGFYQDNELMLILDYCEGDIYLSLFNKREEYNGKLDEKYKWYTENC